jgi:hypothetical protein
MLDELFLCFLFSKHTVLVSHCVDKNASQFFYIMVSASVEQQKEGDSMHSLEIGIQYPNVTNTL